MAAHITMKEYMNMVLQLYIVAYLVLNLAFTMVAVKLHCYNTNKLKGMLLYDFKDFGLAFRTYTEYLEVGKRTKDYDRTITAHSKLESCMVLLN